MKLDFPLKLILSLLFSLKIFDQNIDHRGFLNLCKDVKLILSKTFNGF